MNKIINAIKIISILQLLMFGWAVYILVDAGKEATHKMAGLGVILPASIYIFLGILNIVFCITYGYKLHKNKLKPKKLILFLITLVILLTVFSPQIFQAIERQL